MQDSAYLTLPRSATQMPHGYGDQVHLAADPLLLGLLAQASSPDCRQPRMGRLVDALYVALAGWAVANELPRQHVAVPTRMAAHTPLGVWRGEIIAKHTRAVSVALARAGTPASQAVFALLCELLDPQQVRQDHIFLNRALDAAGQVEGVEVSGTKLGGPVAGAYVLVPDPMGATGSSMCWTLDMYKRMAGGPPARLIALNLVVTPEYLAAMGAAHPEVPIYALRLDRGLSPAEVLASPLGARADQERGLDDNQYIVPGAGGLGEVLNHTHA